MVNSLRPVGYLLEVFIAERLSVRHIIVRVRRVLMGLLSEVVLVCMYVCP